MTNALLTGTAFLGTDFTHKSVTTNGESRVKLTARFSVQATKNSPSYWGSFWVDQAHPLFNRLDSYKKGDAVLFSGELTKVSAYRDKNATLVGSLDVSLNTIAWCPRNELKRQAEDDINRDAVKRARSEDPTNQDASIN